MRFHWVMRLTCGLKGWGALLAALLCLHCASGDAPTDTFSVDPCEVANGGCSDHATCTSFSRAVTCACKDGFEGNGWQCDPIDVCAFSNGGCGVNSTCKLQVDETVSVACECKAGFTGDGSIRLQRL